MARPSKFTPEAARIICEELADGATYEEAANAAGVSYVTFLSWKQKGEKDTEGPYLEFFNDIKRAEDCSKQTLLSRIKDAGKDPRYWQANAWILERRFPKEFGKRERVDLGNADGKPITVKVVKVGSSEGSNN